jgi:hypothetical protein
LPVDVLDRGGRSGHRIAQVADLDALELAPVACSEPEEEPAYFRGAEGRTGPSATVDDRPIVGESHQRDAALWWNSGLHPLAQAGVLGSAREQEPWVARPQPGSHVALRGYLRRILARL